MKKILFAAYSLEVGGIEKALTTLANTLQEKGYKVSIALEKKQGIFLKELNKNIEIIEYKPSESKNILKRNSKVIYYDCTNYFFEIDEEDDLRKYGISKEHKPNPIVGMGLFMDGDGLPLSCNIYPGNMNEQKTLIPEETKIVDNFKLDDSKIILCTDAGLASDEIKKYNNIEYYHELH